MNLKTALLFIIHISLLSLVTSCGGTTDDTLEEEIIVSDGDSNDDSGDGSDDGSNDDTDDDSSDNDIELTTSYFITPNGHEDGGDYEWNTSE